MTLASSPTAPDGLDGGLVTALRLVALAATAVVTGGTIAIWRGYPPQGLSAAAFIEMHQGAVRGLNLLFPLIGAVAILCTTVLAVMYRHRRDALICLVLAVALMIVSALTTRFGNQPINAIVMGWAPQSPPEGWQMLRDRWWTWHLLRTATTSAAFLALALPIAAGIPCRQVRQSGKAA